MTQSEAVAERRGESAKAKPQELHCANVWELSRRNGPLRQRGADSTCSLASRRECLKTHLAPQKQSSDPRLKVRQDGLASAESLSAKTRARVKEDGRWRYESFCLCSLARMKSDLGGISSPAKQATDTEQATSSTCRGLHFRTLDAFTGM